MNEQIKNNIWDILNCRVLKDDWKREYAFQKETQLLSRLHGVPEGAKCLQDKTSMAETTWKLSEDGASGSKDSKMELLPQVIENDYLILPVVY